MSALVQDWIMSDLKNLLKRESRFKGTQLERTGEVGGSRYSVDWKGDNYRLDQTTAQKDRFAELIDAGYNPYSFEEFAKSIYDPTGGEGRHKGLWTYGDMSYDMKRNPFKTKRAEVKELEQGLRDMYEQYLTDAGGKFSTNMEVTPGTLELGEGTAGKGEWTTEFQPGNIFDRESLVAGIEGATGEQSADPSTYTAFTPEMFKKLRTEYYQPEIEEKRGALLSDLVSRQRTAKHLGSGLAGYGQREAKVQDLTAGYESGVEDIYTGVEGQRASALQDIYDVMGQYETIGEIG
jgi:hypothetical protein